MLGIGQNFLDSVTRAAAQGAAAVVVEKEIKDTSAVVAQNILVDMSVQPSRCPSVTRIGALHP